MGAAMSLLCTGVDDESFMPEEDRFTGSLATGVEFFCSLFDWVSTAGSFLSRDFVNWGAVKFDSELVMAAILMSFEFG